MPTVYRVDPSPVMTTAGNAPADADPALFAVAGSGVSLYSDFGCTVPVLAYTDATGATPCPMLAPVTLPGSNIPQSVTGAQGQFGFWLPAGTYYYRLALPSGIVFSGFPVTAGGGPSTPPIGIVPWLASSDYNWSRSPGGALAIGANNIVIGSIPPGVVLGGTAYISGGAGTAEAVTISGVGVNNIIVTCANTHSGAWTIGTATAGISEALAAAAGVQRVWVPAGVSVTHAPITITGASAYLFGDINTQEQNSTVIQSAHTGHTIVPTALINKTLVISDMYIKGTGTDGDGIHMDNCEVWEVKNCWITNHGGHGFYKFQCYGGVERDVHINSNQKNGSYVRQCNAVTIENPQYSGNGLDGAANHSGIYIDGEAVGTACMSITILGGNAESNGAGASGFGVTIKYAQNVNLLGLHLESNTVYNLWCDSTVLGMNLVGIYSLGNQMSIGAHHGTVHGCTFQGGTNGLALTDTDQELDFLGNQYIGTPAVYWGTSKCYEHMDIFSTAAPATGTWAVGRICWNKTPVGVGGVAGWVCVTAGSPGVWLPFSYAGQNPPFYIASETGGANAIAGAAAGAALASGLTLQIKLGHTLQAGANTFNLNGGGAVAIKSARNPANDIAVAYAATGTITLLYDSTGPYYLDMSQ